MRVYNLLALGLPFLLLAKAASSSICASTTTLIPTPIGCVPHDYYNQLSRAPGTSDLDRTALTGRNECIQKCSLTAGYTYAYSLDQTQECFCSTNSTLPAAQIQQGFGKYGDCQADQAYVSYLTPQFQLDECFTNIYGSPLRESVIPSVAACMSYCDLETDPLPPPVAALSPLYNASTRAYDYYCKCYDIFIDGVDPTDCGKDVVWRYTRGVPGDFTK